MAWYYWVLIAYVPNFLMWYVAESDSESAVERALAKDLMFQLALIPFSMPLLLLFSVIGWALQKVGIIR